MPDTEQEKWSLVFMRKRVLDTEKDSEKDGDDEDDVMSIFFRLLLEWNVWLSWLSSWMSEWHLREGYVSVIISGIHVFTLQWTQRIRSSSLSFLPRKWSSREWQWWYHVFCSPRFSSNYDFFAVKKPRDWYPTISSQDVFSQYLHAWRKRRLLQ